MNAATLTRPSAHVRKRRYLPGPERKRQILDAALAEFLAHGYAETTMEKIAKRATLSKSGLYAHFKSKEQIFEELLATALPSTEDSFSVFLGQSDDDIDTIIEAYIERLYTRLSDPLTVPTFQLLMMENRRIPGLIDRWNDTVLKRMQARSQELIEECVRSGRVKRSVLTDHFEIILSPIVYWLTKSVLVGQQDMIPLDKMREIHKQLLMELLSHKK